MSTNLTELNWQFSSVQFSSVQISSSTCDGLATRCNSRELACNSVRSSEHVQNQFASVRVATQFVIALTNQGEGGRETSLCKIDCYGL
jgi:hypothetical protein